MKTIKDSLGNGITLISLKVLTFITGAMIARTLGPADRGVYVYIMLFVNMFLQICFLGIANSLQYYNSKKSYAPSETFYTNLIIGVITGGLVGGGVYLLWGSELLGDSALGLTSADMMLILFIMPLEGVFYLLRFQMVGLSMFRQSNAHQTLYALLFVGFISFFMFFYEMRVWGCLLSVLLSKAITVIFQLFVLYKNLRPVFRFDHRYIVEIYKYGLKSWIGNISSRANASLDQFILGYIASSSQLGVYSVAYNLLNLMVIPSNAITPVLFNLISKSEDEENRKKITLRVHRFLFWVQVVMSLGLILLGDLLIKVIFGEEYASAYGIMTILIAGIIFYNSTRMVIQKVLAAIGKPFLTSQIQLVGALTGAVAYVILIPLFEIRGAAIGSLLAYLGSTAIALKMYMGFNKVSLKDLYEIRMDDLKYLLLSLKRILKK